MRESQIFTFAQEHKMSFVEKMKGSGRENLLTAEQKEHHQLFPLSNTRQLLPTARNASTRVGSADGSYSLISPGFLQIVARVDVHPLDHGPVWNLWGKQSQQQRLQQRSSAEKSSCLNSTS